MERNPGQIQHIENIGIGHLIADGESDHIKIPDVCLTFQRPQEKLVFSHFRFHVPPGGEDTLTPDAVHLIHHAVQNAHSQIGHSNLIGIRETERHSHAGLGQILFHFSPLSAGIAGWLLYSRQNPLFQFGHSITSLFLVELLYSESG